MMMHRPASSSPATTARKPRGALTRRDLLGGLAAAGLAGCVGVTPVDVAAADEELSPDPAEARSAPGSRRGVNISWWLNLSGELRPSDGELRSLRAAGFGHVRLPVDPDLLGWSPEGAGRIPPRIHLLDRAVDRVLKAGLDLIVDIHPGEDLVAELAEADYVTALAALWRTLAERYAIHAPQRLLFEVVNEPHRFLNTPAELAMLHEACLGAIRASCPEHRVLLNGLFDPKLSLRTLQPLADPNLIYAFQFYDPYAITHQGADWDPSELGGVSALRGLPYPAARLDDTWGVAARAWFHPRAVRLLMAYQRQGWNAARVDARVNEAAEWSARHRVPVLCTEFGVMRTYLDLQSRVAWLHDARAALERHAIPWTVWEYDGLFGITDGCRDRPGRTECRSLESASSAALGLSPEAATNSRTAS
jgi:endoglucanase